MAVVDSDDALVCCVENMVKDRIMDSGASLCATYCKEELERFKLRSGKVRLANDKTLDIAGIGDVVLKTSFGTSWTLKDVRLPRRLRRPAVKVTKGSLVVARGNKCGSLYMVEDWYDEDKETAYVEQELQQEVAKMDTPKLTPLLFDVAERLSRTFRAESTGIRAEAPKMDSRIPEIDDEVGTLVHLKVFGCDSFVKVKDVCGEAMKCTITGSGSDKMRYSFQDTKSHQMKNYSEDKHHQEEASRLHSYEEPQESRLREINQEAMEVNSVRTDSSTEVMALTWQSSTSLSGSCPTVFDDERTGKL
ncbi:hypothetical protein Tco_0516169 [Tanacetum coccineum]